MVDNNTGYNQNHNHEQQQQVQVATTTIDGNGQPAAVMFELESIQDQFRKHVCLNTVKAEGVIMGFICLFNLKFHLYSFETLILSSMATIVCCFVVNVLARYTKVSDNFYAT